MDRPTRTFQDDRLEEALRVSQRLDEVELARFMAKNADLATFDLASVIVRDFFGQLDLAYVFRRLLEAGL